MEINSNHIEFLYTDSIDKNGIVKITKYEANESVAAYSKTLTHEIESSLYTGDYSLSDFGYETLASNDQPINLFIEMTDQALNSEKKALVFNYVDTEITAEGLVILDDDITLFDGDGFTVLSKNKVIDSEEGKIYFDLDPNGGIATKIFSVEIVNPNGYDYKIKIGDTTKQDFDSGSSTQWNISEDITLTPSSPTEVIKIYLGDTVIKELELIGLVDYGDINEDGTLTDTKITVDEVIIYQNKDEVKITGEVEMPTTLVDEYVIQAQFTNNTGNTTSWMNLNDITNINSNKIDFSGTIEYDYDSAAAGDFDMLNIRVYSQLFSTEPTGTVINLDGTNNDDNLNLAAIQVESVLDTDTIWKIGTDEQTIDITNGTSFSLVELYLNGVLNDTQIIPNASGTDDFPTTGTYVDFNNINTIKIVGTNTNVSKVKLEREIAITRASALETPDFITIPKDGEIYTSDFVISGEVNNATKVELVSVKQNGSEISWESGNLPLALTLINGNFYSDNLTDDDLYTTGGAGAGTYTDFANGEGIIEGQEYTAIIRATQENGASTEYEFIGKYDTLAPTEYHENGATKANGGGGYSKFNDNSNTEWIMDTLYFNDSGELIYESGDNSGAGYTEGDLYPNKDELDEAGSDYTIATIGGGYDFDIDTITDTIDIDQGYMALIKNQKGYNDYLIAYIPISESDGDYGTINSEENITVVITDKNGNNLLRKMIRQGATGTDREIFLDLGDNKIEEINVYLQDEHLNKTGEYKFENSLYLAMSAMDVEARIYEGASEGNELKDLRMSQISNTTEMDIALYTTSIDPLNLITNIPNVDVSNAEYSLLLSGNINTGDTLILQATDIYGNNIFEEDRTGYISTTVKDYLPPSLPTATDIIVENKNYPDNNEKDIITGKIEPNAVVILRDENNYELIRTDTDTNGEFSMSLNGDSHSVIKMEIIDESGNSTVDSLLHDNYFAITSKFAQSYNYAVQNLVSVGNSFGIGDGIDLSWTNVSQSPEDIAMGNILKSNKIKFLWGTESVEKVVSTNSETINPEDIGIFDLSTVTIEVYPKSELGFECNSSPSIQISVDTRAPTSAAIDLNEITASVKNDEINVTANALDEAVAGKGSGDILYLGINNIYKEWTGAVLKYTSAEIGTINNSTTFDVKVKDKTGNESSALTLSATDDEAPEISDLRVVEGISTSTRDGVDFLQFKIKHKTEDDVIVYAYDNNTVTNGEPNGTLLGILSLGALDTEILMNVRGADAANVYIFVSDTDKNYSSAVKLNTIVEE
ncbi:MAG: hypothetical protein B6I28_03275 [Fusobacteriia bacterium 4572_132]|nr:MAG: hypothetical protein B6I28_03275 [Fusobacteriia bacterium 4572_132]